MLPKPTNDLPKFPTGFCSLHDYMYLHILGNSTADMRTRALDMIPEYFANHPTTYLLPFQELMRYQSHKYMKINKLYNDYYRPNPTLFKEMLSTESAGTFSLTNLLCYPAIEYLGSPQQFQHYSKLIEDGRLVAAYTQTEIGHGSDVQRLSTEAVFDRVKKCLIFNTPSIESIKFWPGGLGVFGTHIITQAKLRVEGVSYGLQTFIIQIRDPKTLHPLEGAVIGELGPKLGFKGADNGYLQLENFETPIDSLLQRYIQLDQDGKVTKSTDKSTDKIAYGSMMTLRLNLLRFFTKLQSKGLQMAHVHRKIEDMKPFEARRDIDTLSQYFSFALSSSYVRDLLKDFLASYNTNPKKALGMVPEMHFLTTGFKVLSSWKLIKITRQESTSMGVGNLLMSGVVQLYSDAVPTSTYEGDNVVLTLQVVSIIMKAYRALLSGKTLPPSLAFLSRFKHYAMEQKDFDEVIEIMTVNDLLIYSDKILENFAFKSIHTLSKKMQKAALEDGIPLKVIMSEGLQVELVRAAIQVFEIVNHRMAFSVYQRVDNSLPLNTRDLILVSKILQLHKLVYIKEKLNDILQTRVIKFSEELADIIEKAQEIYYVDLVPELEYLYSQGFLQDKELSIVKDFRKVDHNIYKQAAEVNKNICKNTLDDLMKLSKL